MTIRNDNRRKRMEHREIFWMACDSTEQLRAEYGPFQTKAEDEHIKEVRCVFLELQEIPNQCYQARKLHTRCASCGESAVHDEPWQAEVWADIHEFEHSRHRVRLFEHTRADGLKEIGNWRECA
jgi:hypothetical protein